jgi:hypothetical protein
MPRSNKDVIPGTPTKEDDTRARSEALALSRKVEEYQVLLDPGSHPALRALAGMTNYGAETEETLVEGQERRLSFNLCFLDNQIPLI